MLEVMRCCSACSSYLIIRIVSGNLLRLSEMGSSFGNTIGFWTDAVAGRRKSRKELEAMSSGSFCFCLCVSAGVRKREKRDIRRREWICVVTNRGIGGRLHCG